MISMKGLKTASLALSAIGLAQCERERPPAPPEAPAPVAPVQPAALNRADMIAVLARAASHHAAGDGEVEVLAGRRFSVRLPFGCQGPGELPSSARPGFASWTWDEDRRNIELRLTPSNWLTEPPVDVSGLDAAWAQAEGVWIARPWQSPDVCPPPPPAIAPQPLSPGSASETAAADAPQEVAKQPGEPERDGAPLPPPTPRVSPPSAGLAAYSSIEGSRVGRRDGRPYVYLIRAEGEAPAAPPRLGWRVLLEGRIGTFPDGRSIRCRAENRDQRPVCIVAVQLDKVAFEDGATGGQLAEWRPAG